MFGVDDVANAVLGVASKVIDRVWPDPVAQAAAKFQLLQLAQDGTLKQLMADTDLAKAQDAINQVEAASNNIWVAGWRPFIGWVGGLGFAVQFVAVPLFGYGYSLYTGHAAPPALVLPDILWEVVLGILGLNIGARTYEKVSGIKAGQ